MATTARGLPGAPTHGDELLHEGLPLVGHFVREMLNKVPTPVNRDDLTSVAIAALGLAAQDFDPARHGAFAPYAAIRIRSALIDELRGIDFGARAARSRARQMEAVRNQLTALLARRPTPDEIAAAIGISVSELGGLEADIARARQLSLHGFAAEARPAVVPEPNLGPEALILLREQLGFLHDAIDELPEQLRFVIVAYFFQQRQIADMGAELGVSAARVSQLRAAALMQLRDGSNNHLEPMAAPKPVTEPADSTRHTYAQSIGLGTQTSRLAKGSVRAEVRHAARQVAAPVCLGTAQNRIARRLDAARSPDTWRAAGAEYS